MAKENKRGRYSLSSKRGVSRSVIVCPDCGEPYIVYRQAKKKKKGTYQAGHIKDLWCYKCQGEKKFIQLSAAEAKYNY